MTNISFNPEGWATRTAGFPRLVTSVYLDISLHSWLTGTAMAMAHFRIVTADLGEEQAMGIADMLLGAGKIEQGEDGSIWSPDAVEEWQKAETLRQQRARGGAATAGVAKNRAKPKPRKKPTVKPAEAVKSDVQPAPPLAEDVEAAEVVLAAVAARQEEMSDVQRLGEAWNKMASANNLSQIELMTDKRKEGAAARIKEYGIDRLIHAIGTIPQSAFLMGQNDSGWKGNFDWMIRAERCAKLVEGGYIEGEGGGKPSGWR